MSTGRRIDRKGAIPKGVLANRQASGLVRAYRQNPTALVDLNGEIERGADQANLIAMRAQSCWDKL